MTVPILIQTLAYLIELTADQAGNCHRSCHLLHRLADRVCSLGFSLCSDDICLSFLLCLLNNESCTLGFLLRNLLVLDCTSELLAEGHVRDGHILEVDVEF